MDYFRAWHPACSSINEPPTIMAAKKTAKKTTESAPAKAPAAATPVAKKAAKKAAQKTAPAKSATKAVKSPAAKPAATKPSSDAIARAAYLNYRRRVEQGLPGDSHSDWLEAERQLAKSGGA
jgi:hypothetical protein